MHKISHLFIAVILIQCCITGYGQEVAINKDNSSAGASSVLHIKGDNAGIPVEAMFIESSTGNIGLGTTIPGFPLTFKNEIGPKISFWGQSGNHYGFGIDHSLLQIYTAASSADIAFGFGRSSSFSELVRINGNGQVGIGTTSPHTSAALEVSSTTGGFLPPRMTQMQMEAIASPATGLNVYNTDLNALCFYNGTSWDCLDTQSLYYSTFICGNTFTVINTGYSFSTVLIGSQCWMAENLNVGTMIDFLLEQSNNSIVEKFCYENNEDYCDTYGGFYQWDEMMQYTTTAGMQGICPQGWHLPTDNEWKELEMKLGMAQAQADAMGWRGTNQGGKMKETDITHWDSPNTGATNSSGFTAFGGGERFASEYTSSGTVNLKIVGKWWSSNQKEYWKSWYRELEYVNADVYRYYEYKSAGHSVRCIMD